MLSLKDFKEYEIKGHDSLVKISGGISCPGIDGVLNHLDQADPDQFDAVVNQLSTIGVQCIWGNATCTGYLTFSETAYYVTVQC